MEHHLNEIAIAVPLWPETKIKPRYKPGRLQLITFTNKYLYPTLFFFYFIALWMLFATYKLLLSITLRLYLLIKRLEKQKLKRRLVIVGGGYAGTCAAKSLEHDFLVTLIDNKDYFEFTPSKLRLLVDPRHSRKVQIKHKHFLPKTLIVTDVVKLITPDSVITETQSISFDYLIICTGSRNVDFKWSSNINTDSKHFQSLSSVVSVRSQHFEDYHSMVKSAQNVLIVGGGTVGVELAGEIIDNFKDKNVTIVHSHDTLMNRSPQRAIKYTEDYFYRNGATLIFKDKVVGQEGNRFTTTSGKLIEADIAFNCTGNLPNTECLRNEFFSHYLNDYGFVKVNPYLQLQGYSNIFIAGDLTDIPEEEEKLCQTAASEVKTVVANIQFTEAGLPLTAYVPKKCPMLVSLGKYDGVLMYRGWTFFGFVPAAMKEFVEWKEMIYYWNWNHFQFGQTTKEQWSSHAHIV